MPNALQSLASPAASGPGLSSIFDEWNIFAPGSGSPNSGLSGLLNLISGSNNSAYGQLLNADIGNIIFSSGFYMPGNYWGTAADYMGLAGGQAAQRALGDIAEGPLGPALSGPLGAIASFANSIDAGLGRAALVGPLSVPPSWTAPAPLHSPLSSTVGGHTTGAPAGGGSRHAPSAAGQHGRSRLRPRRAPTRLPSQLRGTPTRRRIAGQQLTLAPTAAAFEQLFSRSLRLGFTGEPGAR